MKSEIGYSRKGSQQLRWRVNLEPPGSLARLVNTSWEDLAYCCVGEFKPVVYCMFYVYGTLPVVPANEWSVVNVEGVGEFKCLGYKALSCLLRQRGGKQKE